MFGIASSSRFTTKRRSCRCSCGRIDGLLNDLLDAPAEAIFVDDGSVDCSSIILEAKAKDDPRYRYIRLTRNFGHQIAITAGMDAAAGDAVIVMDADLQDPPEVVVDMIAQWKEGFDVVYARRLSREGEGAFKRWTAAAVLSSSLSQLSSVDIPRDVGDFRLDRSQGARSLPLDAGAEPLCARHVRLARIQADRGRIPSPCAGCGRDQVSVR